MQRIPGGGRRSDQQRERGFTLIELLIVILLLGILGAVVVFAVGSITDRGTKSACKADLTTVAVAEEAYFAKTGANIALPDLVTQKLLRSVPDTSHYVMSVNTATGEVSRSQQLQQLVVVSSLVPVPQRQGSRASSRPAGVVALWSWTRASGRSATHPSRQ